MAVNISKLQAELENLGAVSSEFSRQATQTESILHNTDEIKKLFSETKANAFLIEKQKECAKTIISMTDSIVNLSNLLQGMWSEQDISIESQLCRIETYNQV
jgi:hypothetical protein